MAALRSGTLLSSVHVYSLSNQLLPLLRTHVEDVRVHGLAEVTRGRAFDHPLRPSDEQFLSPERTHSKRL